MKDYKDRNTYIKLGLRKGKSAIKTGKVVDIKRKTLLWVGLFLMVFIVNYLFFIHFKPLKTESIDGLKMKNHKSPLSFEDWFEKGCNLQEEGNLIGAYDAYSKAINLRPEDSNIYVKRGVVCVKMENYYNAIRDLKRAISLNPDCMEAFVQRGSVYLKQQNFDYAINDCNYALSLDPNIEEAYFVRGIAFREKGLSDKAKNDFKKSCELGNNNGCQEYEEILYSMNDWT